MRATLFLPLVILQTAGNLVNETVTLNQALSIIQDTTMMRPFEFDTTYGNKCTNGFNKTYLTERYEDSLNDSHVYSEFCVTSDTSKIIILYLSFFLMVFILIGFLCDRQRFGRCANRRDYGSQDLR